MQNIKSEFGVDLPEAHDCYCRPDILERFLCAGNAAGWSIGRTGSMIEELTPEQEARFAVVHAYMAAESEVIRDVRAKLIDGRLVAMGFVAGPSGRDPDAPRRRIPDDVLQARDGRIEWGKGQITGNGLTFVGVRVGPALEAPGAAVALLGCNLRNCFQQVVLDDWMRVELQEFALHRFPGWDFSLEQFHPFVSDRWPVRFENWSDSAHSVSLFKDLTPVAGEPLPTPPKEVIDVRIRVEEQVRRLITWLRDGTLVAEGTKEPPDHELTRVKIPSEWWARAGVDMDVQKNTLCSGPYGRESLIFSDIKMITPEAAAQKSADVRSNDELPLPKGRPGRPQTWDWPGAERELKILTKLKDGLPHPQRRIEDYIKNWFVGKCENHPSDSSIRKFVRKKLPPDYHHKNRPR